VLILPAVNHSLTCIFCNPSAEPVKSNESELLIATCLSQSAHNLHSKS